MLANREEDQAFWLALASFDTERLSSDARRWAGERWARRAQMEHASIASFAKFSLQLVMVAAPPSLLADAHRAAVDEIHHARVSFAVASRLLGQPLGPGPVDLDGDVVGERTLAAVAAETMRDGCVGETLAVAEAREAGERAADPAIRHAMSCLHRDEQRHAELAWRFAAWAAEVGGAPNPQGAPRRVRGRRRGERTFTPIPMRITTRASGTCRSLRVPRCAPPPSTGRCGPRCAHSIRVDSRERAKLAWRSSVGDQLVPVQIEKRGEVCEEALVGDRARATAP